MIISERQKAAARLNGAKSRGPKTEAGKRRSSRNGCKHNLRYWGLRLPDAFATNGGIHQYSRARALLAPGESPDAFARLLEELRAICQPHTPKAESALHILAANTWLQNRVRATEISLMNAEMDRIAPLHSGADFHTLAFLACERVPIDLLGRSEARYERRINRAEDILDQESRKPRPQFAPQAPAKSLNIDLQTRQPLAFNTETAQNPEPKTAAAASETLPIFHPNVFEPAATPEPPTAAPQPPAESQKIKPRTPVAARAKRIQPLTVVSTETQQPFVFNAGIVHNPEPKPDRITATHTGISPQRTRTRCCARTATRPANARRLRNGQAR